MTCAVCSRQARGFGWFNARLPRSDPRRHSDKWVFCSMRCQAAFSQLMDRVSYLMEGCMIDPSDMELAAMQGCLPPLGDYVAALGMERPLANYSKDEILGLIDVIVTAYQERMTVEHERLAQQDRDFLEARLARRPQPANTSGVPF